MRLASAIPVPYLRDFISLNYIREAANLRYLPSAMDFEAALLSMFSFGSMYGSVFGGLGAHTTLSAFLG